MKSDITTLRNIFDAQSLKIDELDIESEEDILTTIKKFSSQDLVPRTIKGHNKEALTKLYEYLAREYCSYFKEDKEYTLGDFDNWHYKMCLEVQTYYKKQISVELQYGKAQKIINMTFKYCFCLKNAEKYINKFQFCHMPLDSYTLDGWFKQDVLSWKNKNLENKSDKLLKTKIPAWSNLTDVTYGEIQNIIREYLQKARHIYKDEKRASLTSFQTEFYVWAEQRWLRSIKDLDKQDILKDNFPHYSHENIYNKTTIKLFRKIIKSIKKFK